MDLNKLNTILTIGETIAVEFKRCGNGIESDTYETVCSFLNRFGGDIFLGVLDDGTVVGVPEKAAPDMVKNFIKVISNPVLFSPTVYLVPEIIRYDEKRTIIHIYIPPSAEVHSYKKVIYDRVDDADVKVTATGTIAQMYIRKQEIFTERKVYPYARMEDLRLDLLPKIRIMAANNSSGIHLWSKMSDEELLKSARLYSMDRVTGKSGLNLAAIMLLGKDDVILDVAPAYVTDALLRKVNVDRYDDREIIKTNLIESYEQLMAFGRKHLPDKFYMEDDQRKSLRNIITREMIANTLIHREYTSSYQAKFIIEKKRMYIENANRASQDAVFAQRNIEPNPKNPIIASFFRNIGYADQLGSGVRNLFKYSKFYSGEEPQFVEGDVFRIIVPLNEMYSFDHETDVDMVREASWAIGKRRNATLNQGNATLERSLTTKDTINETLKKKSETLESKTATLEHLSETEKSICCVIHDNPSITQKMIHDQTGISLGTIKRILPDLQQRGVLVRVGGKRFGKWVLNGGDNST